MRRKYICTNGVVEVTQFVVGDKSQVTGKRWRKAKSQEDKRDENARQAVRVAARILNCNYGPESCLVTLTYSDESAEMVLGATTPKSAALTDPFAQGSLEADAIWETARGILAKSLEAVRRKAKRADIPMKTFAVTSDLDQETGELVRVHHHVVVNAEAAALLEEHWKHGHVHTEHLYRQDDYTPLAAYLLGQVRHKENRKKYSCSRNMVQPKVEEMVLAEDPCNEIRVQPGAKVLDRTPYREGTVNQYVRYKRKPSTRKRGGSKLGVTTPQSGKRDSSPCAGEPLGGGSEFRDVTAEGGSENEFQKITRG